MTQVGKKGVNWTEQRLEMLRSLWLTPISARAIAEKINSTGSSFSRLAIIGKAHHLALPLKKDMESRTARPRRAA